MSNLVIIHCGLLLLFLNCVNAEVKYSGELGNSEFRRFSLWPSVHNGASLMRIRRESQAPSDVAGPNEGVQDVSKPSSTVPTVPQQVANKTEPNNNVNGNNTKTETAPLKQEVTQKVPDNTPVITTVKTNETSTVAVTNVNDTIANVTVVQKVKQIDLSSPGVVKRGLIVFGGFALMAVAYLIFYRKKSKNNETNSSHSMIDANQFRYGVLQSEDKRENELSRIPLTMESEDEDDEDLEIFDLEQKKKSLSYVNLQTNDEEVVLSPRETSERGDLLLDIEDATNSDTLINWSSSHNKSIL